MTIAEQLCARRGQFTGIRNRAKHSQICAHWSFLSANREWRWRTVYGESLGNRLRQMYQRLPIGEIDNLIGELQTLRKKLQTDGERIEQDIGKYAELNQQVMQLTSIIADTVKKLPGASGISR